MIPNGIRRFSSASRRTPWSRSGTRLPYPPKTADLHHEVELVVALRQGGSNIPAADAASLIFGYAVGIDLTRRDLQAEAKKAGRPWDMGKGFDHSAPIGALATGSSARRGIHQFDRRRQGAPVRGS